MASTSPSLAGSAARGSAITLAAQAVRAVVQFGTVIVLTRLLSPDDFGLLAMVVAITGFAEILRDFGLSSAVLSAPKLTTGQRTNLFWLNSGIGLVIGGLLVAFSPVLGILYSDPRVVPVATALSMTLLLNGMSTQFIAGLARDLRYGSLAMVEVGALVVSSSTAIALAAWGFGLNALIAQQISLALITLIAAWAVAKWTPGLPQRAESIRSFISFGANLFGTRMLAYAAQNADSVALGFLWNAKVVGFYSRAYQLVSVPLNQLNAPLTRVALPVLSRVADDPPRLAHYLSRAQLASCYMTAPLLLLLAGLSEPVVVILFGDRWIDVAPILTILCIGAAFRSVAQVAFWMYLATGHSGAQLCMYLITQPLVIIAVAIGATQGAVGAAVGYSTGYFIFWIIAQLHACRTIGLSPRGFFGTSLRALLLVALPCGGVGLLATMWVSSPWLSVLAAVGGCLAIAGVMILLVPAVRSDFRNGLSLVSRLWKR